MNVRTDVELFPEHRFFAALLAGIHIGVYCKGREIHRGTVERFAPPEGERLGQVFLRVADTENPVRGFVCVDNVPGRPLDWRHLYTEDPGTGNLVWSRRGPSYELRAIAE